jgi:predicted Zn finger-like uncharacterized protein
VQLTCDQCQTAYEIDDRDPSLTGSRRRLRFRCGGCGNIVVTTLGGTDASTDSVPPSDSSAGRSAEPLFANKPTDHGPQMHLRQSGRDYTVRDLAALQRWIVERRVLREDLVSVDGVHWEPVGQVADLNPFFQVVEQADRAFDLETSHSSPLAGIAAPVGYSLGMALAEHGGGVSDPDTASQDATASEQRWPEVGPDLPTAEVEDTIRGMPPLMDDGEPLALQSDVTEGGGLPLLDSHRSFEEADSPTVSIGAIGAAGATSAAPPAPPPSSDASDIRMLDDWTEEVEDRPPSPKATPELDPSADWPAEPDDDWGERPRRSPFVAGISAAILVVAVGGWWLMNRGSTDLPASGAAEHAASLAVGPTDPAAQAGTGAESGGTAAATIAAGAATAATPEGPPPTAQTVSAPASASQAIPAPASAAQPSTAPAALVSAPPAAQDATAPVAAADTAKKPVTVTKLTTAKAPAADAGAGASTGALLNQGWAAINKGRFSEARDRFERASQRAPSSADSWYGLGYAEEKLGRGDEARGYYCRALNLADPSSETGREIVGRLNVNGMACG